MYKKPQKDWADGLDLTDRESDVFLSLVQRGHATLQEVAQGTTLPRTTVKSIIDRLVERGLVSQERRGASSVYTPEEPDTIIAQEQSRLQALQGALRGLETMYFSSNYGIGVRVFDTPRSIQKLMVRTIKETPRGSIVSAFESPAAQNYERVMSAELLKTIVDERLKKDIHIRMLVPGDEATLIRDPHLEAGISVRNFPPDVDFSASMWLFHRSLVLFSGNQALAVEITHPEIYQSMQSVSDHLWENGKPYRRK